MTTFHTIPGNDLLSDGHSCHTHFLSVLQEAARPSPDRETEMVTKETQVCALACSSTGCCVFLKPL